MIPQPLPTPTHVACGAALCAAALLLFAPEAHADYIPPAFYDMVGNSDLVALGTITAVSDKTYTFTIEETLAGRADGPTVEVERFQDWACSMRWAPYKKGQRLIIYADVKPPQKGSVASQTRVYRTRSAGIEGEMPVVGPHVFYQGFPIEGLKPAMHTVEGGSFYGHRLKLTEMTDAIRNFNECFKLDTTRVPPHNWRRVTATRFLCDLATRERYARSSPIHAYLNRTATGN